MRLSWNEIRTRAAAFAREWADATYEKGETQSFYNDFFDIFGVRRRTVARYEEHVKRLDNTSGFIDLFWPGVLLVEQKSAGRDLTAAGAQAATYFDALQERERPRYQLLCDFQTFQLLDRDEREESRFALTDLPQHVEKFGFIIGVERRTFRDQDPVNIQAAELMARLHDALKASGYAGDDLERFLVRTVFCLFADDTGIFEPRGIFMEFIEERTAVDGADRERADAGGVRAGGGAVSRVVRGARPRPGLRVAAPRGCLHPYSPGIGPDGETALGRDPHALRLARRQSGPPGEPGRGRPGAEARRHQGLDPGSLSGRGPEAPRSTSTRARSPASETWALFSVMLYSFARVSAVLGMRRQDYYRQDARGVAQAPRERRTTARRPGSPPGGGGPRRLPRCLRARGRGGGAVSERGPGGGEAERAAADAAGGPGHDQAACGGGGPSALDLLPHVPGDGDHGVPLERGDP